MSVETTIDSDGNGSGGVLIRTSRRSYETPKLTKFGAVSQLTEAGSYYATLEGMANNVNYRNYP